MELEPQQESPEEIENREVELDPQESPAEIKRREVELDPQQSPGETRSREVEHWTKKLLLHLFSQLLLN